MSRHDLERMAAESKRATKPHHKPTPEDADREPGADLRSAVGNAGMGRLLDPSVGSIIEAELGGGKPLATTPGAQRSARRADDDVRIHDDGTAAQLSRELGAVAFTYGRDVFLAGNAPDLGSEAGRAMLRHELTHVDQQAESGTTRPKRVSSPGSPAEKQATRAQAGTPVTGAVGSAGASAVHRQEEEEEMQLMRADTVHRQEELPEEELATMPADTVHRQEEEEEEMAMAMPADTVHRQEEEEEMQLMRADTVHRQEELPEEELAMMPAETVHRQEVAEQTTAAAPAPANAALAALFNGTVTEKLRTAQSSVGQETPDYQAALAALTDARNGIRAVADTYSESDPSLFTELALLYNSTSLAIARTEQRLGITSDQPLSGTIGTVINMAVHVGPTLH